MYGTREDLCRMLNEQYPAETLRILAKLTGDSGGT